MGKETDLWDDSALVNAMDNAMAKYKKMHSDHYHHISNREEVVCSSTEDVPASVDESQNAKSLDIAVDNVIHASNIATNTGENHDHPPTLEYYHAGSCTPEYYTHSSHGPCMQKTLDGNSDPEGLVEYSQLLNQYHEIEEQRQKVLQKLYQVGYWPYQSPAETSGSYLQWGNCSTSQECRVPKDQLSHSEVFPGCCPYVCHCLVTPCSSMSVCALDGACVAGNSTASTASISTCPGKLSPLEDDSVVKTAMGAAERAISSMKIETSGTSLSYKEEKGKGRKAESGSLESEVARNVASETDLSVVLNAWYSAGFYTGKYLMEQSIAKGRHG